MFVGQRHSGWVFLFVITNTKQGGGFYGFNTQASAAIKWALSVSKQHSFNTSLDWHISYIISYQIGLHFIWARLICLPVYQKPVRQTQNHRFTNNNLYKTIWHRSLSLIYIRMINWMKSAFKTGGILPVLYIYIFYLLFFNFIWHVSQPWLNITH